MGFIKIALTLTLVLAAVPSALGQSSLLRRAQAAFRDAQEAQAALEEKSAAARSRSEYLRVIDAYERVYLITPHTSYADDALMAIAELYEEIDETDAAVRTLQFLVSDYPSSPFRSTARQEIARLTRPAVRTSVDSGGSTVHVDNVRYFESETSIRVVVDLNGPVTFTQGEAKSPERIFVDISPARLSSSVGAKEWPVESTMLHRIRVGQYDNTTVRVVLDIGRMRNVTSFTLRDPDRVIIDVFGEEPVNVVSTAPSTTASEKSAAPKTAAPPPKAAAVPETKTAAADPAPGMVVTPASPTDLGNHSLIRSLGLKVSRVVLDPGHGGHDTGTIGPSGLMEKELVLDIAERLKALIEEELGAEVVLTRTDDTFVPLEARTSLANAQQADLFISIHANSSRTRSVRGVETFFLGLTESREALETAARENAASARSIHELQDMVRKIMLQDKAAESQELARHIQEAMTKGKGSGQDRGVKQAHFVVLIGANMPSVLAETNFLSNPQEERLLKTSNYRQQIAEALLEGVRSYSDTLSGLKTAKSQGK